MKTNYYANLLKRMILILIASAVLGTMLLVLAFFIPPERIRENVYASADVLLLNDISNISDNSFSRYIWQEREQYTDAIMVQNAMEQIEGKNAFEHAMWVYHSDLDPEIWSPEDSLRAYCTALNTEGMFLHEYSRYWHGYLVYLRPLLSIFTWSQVLTIEVVIQIVLFILVLAVAWKKKDYGVIAAVLTGTFFIKPTVVMASLTMSVCWLITLGAILYMLLRQDSLEQKNRYPEFFLILGILTAYFDFLTYPAVTVGFPLCVYFLLKLKENQNLKSSLAKLILYGVSWCIGYVGMWGLKWVVADLTLHTGTIKDAAWSIIGRTESIGGRPRMNGGLYVIGLNLQEYKYMIYAIAAVVIGVMAVVATIYALRKTTIKIVLTRLLPYIIICCIPFLWIIVVQHHSALHARFTFRIISIAAMAGCCMIIAIKDLFSKKSTCK